MDKPFKTPEEIPEISEEYKKWGWSAANTFFIRFIRKPLRADM